jgi:hypothetical protein
VYTDNHIKYVAAGIIKLYRNREAITGLRRVYATKLLSHFTARFEPITAAAAPYTTTAVSAAAGAAGSALQDGVSAAVDAVARVASAAGDRVVAGLQKAGGPVSSNGSAAAAAGAPAGDFDEASDQTDVAEGGVRDSFAQEAQQPLRKQQAW